MNENYEVKLLERKKGRGVVLIDFFWGNGG